MIKKITIGNLIIGTYASGFLLEKHSGFGMASVRVDMKDRGHYHGANFGYAYYGKRAMVIDGEIVGTDVEDYEAKRQAMAQNFDILRGLQTVLITSHDGKVYRTEAIIADAVEMPYEKGKMVRGKFQLTLLSEKPFFDGGVEKSGTVKIYEGGGFAIPFSIPLPLDQGEDTTEILANDGNGYAYPVMTVYGSMENPTITNNATDEQMNIAYTLGASDYIVIDCYNRTAMLNGSTNVVDKITGDWLRLKAGNNEIRLSTATSDANARVEMVWRDSYVGI